eukprot:15457980-Alexandrium_andersonii.AAC.1
MQHLDPQPTYPAGFAKAEEAGHAKRRCTTCARTKATCRTSGRTVPAWGGATAPMWPATG